MKKTTAFLITCFLFLFLPKLSAVKKVSGYYIGTKNDSNLVTIQIAMELFSKRVNIHELQYGFKCTDGAGHEMKITEDQAQRFGFNYEGENYVFHLVKEVQMPPMFGVDHPTASFLRVLRSGTCSLYQAIFSFSSGWYYEYFLKKPDGYHLTVITPNNTGGKELDEFFADCPALLKKINSNEYRHDRHRYEHMVDDYNGACPPR